jgi:hypothetical protein
MSFYDVVMIGMSLLMAAIGVGLFGMGAYGAVRFRPFRMDHAFTVKQRIQFTLFGVLLIAIAATQFAGLAGEL